MPQHTLTKLGMAQRHALQSLGKQDGLFTQKMTTKDAFVISLVMEKLTANRNQKMMITRAKMMITRAKMMITRAKMITIVKLKSKVKVKSKK